LMGGRDSFTSAKLAAHAYPRFIHVSHATPYLSGSADRQRCVRLAVFTAL